MAALLIGGFVCCFNLIFKIRRFLEGEGWSYIALVSNAVEDNLELMILWPPPTHRAVF